ncbi:MAG: hypothetical protein ACPIOQ_48195 [Promethearchaeia archaeon]
MVVRTYEQECAFVKQVDGCSYSIGQGFVDSMRVPGHFYVNEEIKSLLFDELKQFSRQVCSHGPTWLCAHGRSVWPHSSECVHACAPHRVITATSVRHVHASVPAHSLSWLCRAAARATPAGSCPR